MMPVNLNSIGEIICLSIFISTYLFSEIANAAGSSSRRDTRSLSPESSSRDTLTSKKTKHHAFSSRPSTTTPLKLEQISVLFAHGVTCPNRFKTTLNGEDFQLKEVPGLPIYWSHFGETGSYTTYGMEQIRQLGKALNIKYAKPLNIYRNWKPLKFLSRVSDPLLTWRSRDDIIDKQHKVPGIEHQVIAAFCSSNLDRTRHSANHAVEGLVQQYVWVPTHFKINGIPDHLSLGKCPALERNVKTNKKDKFRALGQKYQYLMNIFNAKVPPSGDFKNGDRINSIEDLWIVVDNIMRERASGRKHAPPIEQFMDDYTKFYFEYMNVEYGTDVSIVNHLRIGQLFHAIITNVKTFVETDSAPSPSPSIKINLYSSYDVTIISLLKALGVNPANEILQKYGLFPVLSGSALIFELYSTGLVEKEYFVQVVFNKDSESINAVPLLLDGCMNVVCPWKIFLRKFSGLTLTEKSFREKCNE